MVEQVIPDAGKLVELAEGANDLLEFTRFEGPYPGAEWIKHHHQIIRDALSMLRVQASSDTAKSEGEV